MKQTLFVLAVLALAFASGCQKDAPSAEAEAPTLREALPGTWEVTFIRVNVFSADGQQDSSYLFELKEEDWQPLLQMKPYRTYFAPDSTYRTVRRTVADQLVNEDKGLWNVFGDTLLMIQPDVTYQYKARIRDGQLQMVGLVDWDRDGQEDDSYYAIQRYVGKTSRE